jgi:hypothetical protein
MRQEVFLELMFLELIRIGHSIPNGVLQKRQ